MIFYNLKQIDQFNRPQNVQLLSDPRFNLLLQFIDRIAQPGLTRDSFGDKSTHKFFKQAKTDDEIVVKRINETFSKITEHNHEEIIKQILEIPFDKVQNVKQITVIIHRGLIDCA